VDEAPRSTVGRASLLSLAFGAFFFDYDLDGQFDIFAANGHIDEEIGRVQPKVSFRQLPHLFRNRGKGRFEEVTATAGDVARPMVARGAAYADYDRDGDLDVLISTNHGPAHLFRNDGGNRNNFVSVRLAGVKSNRSAIGAVVRVETATGRHWRTVHSGSSYCSQSDLALTFGLGPEAQVRSIEIDWPSGQKEKIGPTAANQFLVIQEGKGIVSRANRR
jgi:hypothetical protein